MSEQDTVIVVRKFNAKIGKEEYVKNITVKQTIYDISNDNRTRLCNGNCVNGNGILGQWK